MVPVADEHTLAEKSAARRHELTGKALAFAEVGSFALYRECQALLAVKAELERQPGQPGKWMQYLREYQGHRRIGLRKLRT